MRTGAFWRSSSASALLIVQATRLGVGPADISRRSYRVSVTAGELAMTVSLKYPGSGCPSEARLDRGTSPHSGDHFYLDEHECLRIREQPATSASPRCPPVRPVRLRVFAPPRTSTIPPPTPTPRRVPNTVRTVRDRSLGGHAAGSGSRRRCFGPSSPPNRLSR